MITDDTTARIKELEATIEALDAQLLVYANELDRLIKMTQLPALLKKRNDDGTK